MKIIKIFFAFSIGFDAHARLSENMVLINGGTFIVGESGRGYGYGDQCEWSEPPANDIKLSAFWIAPYEVTNREYTEFANATKRDLPRFSGDSRLNLPEQPVVGVSLEDAESYCRWRGMRLPTEFEWEKAAKGGRDYKYPWGNEVPKNLGSYARSKTSDDQKFDDGALTVPVGTLSEGKNPYGLYDMAGNVWEWTSTPFDCGLYKKLEKGNRENPKLERGSNSLYFAIRGGSWANSPWSLRTTARHPMNLDQKTAYIGFRCVKDNP